MLKTLPSLTPWESVNDIPQTEYNWLLCQIALDNEVRVCPACKHVQNGGYFCCQCGKDIEKAPLKDKDFVCPECDHYHHETDHHCRVCGYDIENDPYNSLNRRIDHESDESAIGVRDDLQKLFQPLPESAQRLLDMSQAEVMDYAVRSIGMNSELLDLKDKEFQQIREEMKQKSIEMNAALIKGIET